MNINPRPLGWFFVTVLHWLFSSVSFAQDSVRFNLSQATFPGFVPTDLALALSGSETFIELDFTDMTYRAESDNDVCRFVADAGFELVNDEFRTSLPQSILLNGISSTSSVQPGGSATIINFTSISCSQSNFSIISPLMGFPSNGITMTFSESGMTLQYNGLTAEYLGDTPQSLLTSQPAMPAGAYDLSTSILSFAIDAGSMGLFDVELLLVDEASLIFRLVGAVERETSFDGIATLNEGVQNTRVVIPGISVGNDVYRLELELTNSAMSEFTVVDAVLTEGG